MGVKAPTGVRTTGKRTTTYSQTFYPISLLQKEICLYAVCKLGLEFFVLVAVLLFFNLFFISWIVMWWLIF